ncbi:A/G-specific adenine glycosylase, partial [gut metagenome]
MQHFAHTILTWYDSHRRELPWRNISDAYRIWVSEIILQQTRVAQGYDYYLRFIDTFPTVEALAEAPEDQVLLLWQGLGYYSRARNLHAAARQIVEQGGFPTDYPGVRALKGVGDYTAAAICSFAYDLPCAVVDGTFIAY